MNDPLLVAAAAAALHDRDIGKRSARELQTFVRATLPSTAFEGLRITHRVSAGTASDEILRTAKRERVDLIVMGTHGLTAADRLLIGSTTLSVLQRSAMPILAIPRSTAVAHPKSSWPGGCVMGAIELDGTAAADVALAADVARWFGTSLLLVHVVIEVPAPDWLNADLTAHNQQRVAEAQGRLDRLAVRAARRLAVETRVVSGDVDSEIAAAAASEGVGLIVTVLRDRRGWFGARRGSISYHVLSHAVTPVLAFPSPRPRR